MKLSCAILDDYQNAALSMADWSSLFNQVEVRSFQQHFDEEDELVKAISHCHILVIMRERTPIRASLLARLPNLRLLITSGMRNASIDLEAAKAQGIVICGTGSFSEPPVELTWALILGLTRHLVKENQSLRTGGSWQSSIGIDLYQKQLGLLGLGKIGTKVAQVGRAFGMKVLAYSQNLTKEKTEAAGVELSPSKEDLLRRSDIVSIHLILSERTQNFLGIKELRQMKPSAFLVNTSRAQIVDQAALIEVLRQGSIAGAGLDVFEMEPLPKDHPFRALPNVLATPHLGYVSQANYRTYFTETVEDIKAFLEGSPIRTL